MIVIMFVIKPDVKLENTVDLHMKLKRTTKLVCQNYLIHFQDVAIPFRHPKKSNLITKRVQHNSILTSPPSVHLFSPSLLKLLNLVGEMESCQTFYCLDGDVQ